MAGPQHDLHNLASSLLALGGSGFAATLGQRAAVWPHTLPTVDFPEAKAR
jgi:hypothetical protein